MARTSEFVTLGHPDKTADFISEYLLDRYLEIDPSTRYAVEVMIKDNIVTLGGEVTSKADFSDDEITHFVREAVKEIGYTKEYCNKWGRHNAISGDALEVYPVIGRQSPDIAQGVNRDAWGDQGIFWGMATNETEDYLPMDHSLARKLGNALMKSGLGGLDIKTQVSIPNLEEARKGLVIVAIPMLEDTTAKVKNVIREVIGDAMKGYDIIVNGTGKYVVHGPIGDCGVTGRKLAVDFYGGACRVGGGAPWTKDSTKADLTLNLYARECAKAFLLAEGGFDLSGGCIYCLCSCCIGRPEVEVSYFDKNNRFLGSNVENVPPSKLIEEYGLRKPVFAKMCRDGLFSILK